MSIRFWQSLFGRATRPTVKARRTPRPLRVESLEARVVPDAAGLSAALDVTRLRVDPGSYESSHILVRFREGAEPARGEGARVAHSLVPGLHKVNVAGTTVEEAVAAYAARPDVLYAQPDYRVSLAMTPNDPKYGDLWGLNNTGQTGGKPDADVDAPQAWDVTRGDSGTIVAVIDTGVDYKHPDLAANMWVNPGWKNGLDDDGNGTADDEKEVAGNGIDDDGNGYADDVYGYDFVNGDADPMDDHYHGTHVAGTIAAVGNNGVGVIGVAPNARIMALKFLDASGYGTTSGAIAALDYAVKNGAQISNNSYGGEPAYEQAFADALTAAQVGGHVFVAAAGNGDAYGVGLDNDGVPHYPSNYAFNYSADPAKYGPIANVVAVAATDHKDVLAGFSNFGRTTVDLAAPGVNIVSTAPGGTYKTLSGTSMAAPHVAGVMALVHGYAANLKAAGLDPTPDTPWDYADTIARVLGTVDGLAGLTGKVVTGGRLDAGRAVGVNLGGPSVVAVSPSGTSVGPVSSARVAFSEAIDPATFTVDGNDVVLTGSDATVTAIKAVDQLNLQFDVTFSKELATGSYTLLIGPDVKDAQGSGMDQDRDGTPGEATADQYVHQFTVNTDGVYTFTTAVPEGFQASVTKFIGSGSTSLATTGDERAYAVRLKDKFNFYGTAYSTLYVSTNGLITFGSGNAASANTDLATGPSQRAIAPMWDDWIKTSGTTPMMRYKVGDADGKPDTKELVIEWNQVRGYTSSTDPVTFQVVLQLNTGTKPGAITFLYPDLDTGDYRGNGGSATVGIKDTGTNARRIQVSHDALSPYVGTGKAIRFEPASTGGLSVTSGSTTGTTGGTGTTSANSAASSSDTSSESLDQGVLVTAEVDRPEERPAVADQAATRALGRGAIDEVFALLAAAARRRKGTGLFAEWSGWDWE